MFLRFSREFHLYHINENVYNIRFTYNRINMRRLYQAVEAAHRLEMDVLFRSTFSDRRVNETTPFVPISWTLNEEQMFAVEMILGLLCDPWTSRHG